MRPSHQPQSAAYSSQYNPQVILTGSHGLVNQGRLTLAPSQQPVPASPSAGYAPGTAPAQSQGGWLKQRNRWYDEIELMPQAIILVKHLPPEVQDIIARHFNERVEEMRRLRKYDEELKSIGADHVMNLWRSSTQRGRWHDKDGMLRRAFNQMNTVPMEELTDFSARMIHVAKMVHEKTRRKTKTYSGYSLGARGILNDVNLIMTQEDTPIILKRSGDVYVAQLNPG